MAQKDRNMMSLHDVSSGFSLSALLRHVVASALRHFATFAAAASSLDDRQPHARPTCPGSVASSMYSSSARISGGIPCQECAKNIYKIIQDYCRIF